MEIRTKRIYEGWQNTDGRRILIDRLWPRGLSKKAARIDFWAKSVAPSDQLRKWYGHAPEKWEEFRKRYFAELDDNPAGLADLDTHLGVDRVTLLFGSREQRLNNATALRDYLASPRRGA